MSDVTLTIDGRKVTVPRGTTIFDAARLNGIPIPTLCHQQHQTPVGVCRVCTVEVKNQRVLAAACVRPAEEGMVVATASDTVRRARRTLAELLLADHPSPCERQQTTGDCELEQLGAQLLDAPASTESARAIEGRGSAEAASPPSGGTPAPPIVIG